MLLVYFWKLVAWNHPHQIFKLKPLRLWFVKDLFCFPLAIDQAGAYIASGATTIGDYLAKYSEHQKTSLSHSEFTGASKYNRTVYETWELSYKKIQKMAQSEDTHKANAANSAMILLELFPFFHHEEMTEEIFCYATLPDTWDRVQFVTWAKVPP